MRIQSLPAEFLRIPCTALFLFFGLLPATLLGQVTWDGGGGNNSWSTAENWSGDTLPVDVDGTALVFDGSTRPSNVNDQLTSIGILTFASTASAFTISGNNLQTGRINSNNAATNRIENNLTRVSGSGSEVTIANGSTLELAGVLSGPNGAIQRGASGGGTLRLLNTDNSFTGSISLRVPGVTEFTSVANAGSNSALGAATGAASIIELGSTSTANPTLRYIGSSDSSTNRVVHLNGTTGSRTLDASGDGFVKYLSAFTASGNGSKTLVLTGTSTAANEISSIPDDSISTTVSLSKTGDGTWMLSGANTYTGTTTITSGILQLGAGGTTGSLSTSSAITNNATLGFDRSDTITQGTDFSTAGIGGSGGVQQNGTGTVDLNAVNAYTGSTTITAGTLLISAGNINSTSGVTLNGATVEGATLRYNSSTALSKTLTWTQGTLAGTNWNGALGGLTVGANQLISPGNSPGTASTENQTWGTDGGYLWEINNATGTPGADPGWDLLTGTDTLTITATEANPFTIYVTSLTTGNDPGEAVNFNASLNHQWRIADFANPIVGFASAVFAINDDNFTNGTTPGSFFSVVLGNDPSITGGDNTQIYLTYTIPEPKTAMLLGIGLAAVLIRLRRRK